MSDTNNETTLEALRAENEQLKTALREAVEYITDFAQKFEALGLEYNNALNRIDEIGESMIELIRKASQQQKTIAQLQAGGHS